MLRKALLTTAAWLCSLSLALAQCPGINCTVPNQGLAYINKNRTYSAISVGLVPASSATDIFCLNQSATKAVHISHLVVSGTAGTAITTPVVIKMNHSLDTGGTAATGLALPVGAPLNSSDSAPTATLTAYTANPTVNDTSPNYLAVQAVTFAVTTSTNEVYPFELSTETDLFNKGWDMPAMATPVQQICVNLNAASVSSGVLAIWITWQESP